MLTTLGRSGVLASRIGLGLAALGRPGYINLGHSSDLAGQTDVESLERVPPVLDAAYNRGVRYFDVARSYGKGEAFLREWLRGRRLGPSDVTVGSKWGYTYTAGWRVDAPVNEVKDLLAPRPSAASSPRAGISGPNLRLYQIHSATLDSEVLEDHEVFRELGGLRAGGLAIGLTVAGPGRRDGRAALRLAGRYG